MGDISLEEYAQITRPLLDVIQLLSKSVAVELRTSYAKTSLEGWNSGGGLVEQCRILEKRRQEDTEVIGENIDQLENELIKCRNRVNELENEIEEVHWEKG